jgi:hypothetical protein
MENNVISFFFDKQKDIDDKTLWTLVTPRQDLTKSPRDKTDQIIKQDSILKIRDFLDGTIEIFKICFAIISTSHNSCSFAKPTMNPR